MTLRNLREITDSHFTENYQMESKLGLRFISKIDQRQEYLKASFVESVEQTKPGGLVKGCFFATS
jgi:hypothetical protein